MKTRIAKLGKRRSDSSDELFRFDMTLATEGEATDGDILSIRGGQVPDRIPLLAGHENDPRTALGSIVESRKVAKRLDAVGEIDLGGEGPPADIRRDVAYMIERGHVGAVSIRWDPIKWTPRVDLPKSSPYHVASDESDFRKRYGLFYDAWRAQEGSVVAVGADPAALIKRSEETQGDVRAFWRSAAEHVEAPDESVELLRGIGSLVSMARSFGTDEATILSAIEATSGAVDCRAFERVEWEGRAFYVPAGFRASIEADARRVAARQPAKQRPKAPARKPAARQPVDVVKALEGVFDRVMRKHRQATEEAVGDLVERATGRRKL